MKKRKKVERKKKKNHQKSFELPLVGLALLLYYFYTLLRGFGRDSDLF